MLKNLKLKNFRSHADLELDLSTTTVLIGQNGVGKSNVLEAISILSFCRSFRDDDKKNLVSFGADFARVNGDDLEVFLQKSPSFIFKAKEKGVFKKQADFIGRLKAVVFSPETISIITGSPSSRRKFLDIMISQKNHSYLKALIGYEKVRKERNSLLSRIYQGLAKESELDFWDKELVAEGSLIVKERASAITDLNKEVVRLYTEISGRNEHLEICYINNPDGQFQDANFKMLVPAGNFRQERAS